MGGQWWHYYRGWDRSHPLGKTPQIGHMAAQFKIGDRVQVFLDSKFWKSEGVAVAPWRHWFTGTVIRIDPYSQHRSFYWVELDDDVEAPFGKGTKLISVLNPKNIKKI